MRVLVTGSRDQGIGGRRSRTLEQVRPLFSGSQNECWRLPNEVASPHGNGYYKLWISGQRWFAHRLAYALFVGPIPAGMHIDHQCHNWDPTCAGGDNCPHRACVNPAHLEAVPHKTNVLRGMSPPARNARKRLCANGHELVPLGLRSPRRYCPTCRMVNRIKRGETSGNGHLRTRTHCPQGHPYDDANTYIARNPDGTAKCRMCRACGRERARMRRNKGKQA